MKRYAAQLSVLSRITKSTQTKEMSFQRLADCGILTKTGRISPKYPSFSCKVSK